MLVLRQSGDTLRGEDDGLAQARMAEVPQPAVDEEEVATAHIAAPESLPQTHLPTLRFEPFAHGLHRRLGHLQGRVAIEQERVPARCGARPHGRDRPAYRRLHLHVALAGDEPLEEAPGLAVPPRRRGGFLHVNAVERRLHRPGGDLEGLVVVGAEAEGHRQGGDEDVEPLGRHAPALLRSGRRQVLLDRGDERGQVLGLAAADRLLNVLQPLLKRRALALGQDVLHQAKVVAHRLEGLARLAQHPKLTPPKADVKPHRSLLPSLRQAGAPGDRARPPPPPRPARSRRGRRQSPMSE